MPNTALASQIVDIITGFITDDPVRPEEIYSSIELGELADVLIRLREHTVDLRKRSTELRAVMSSMRDLLSITDAELLLQRIVDQAHELMELDIAYLSVYEESSDQLHVRAATGTTSPRFLNMVVPAGVGLASLAVRTKHPQWVEDYSQLSSVPHDPTIDEIVREEQLRSLLGTPLVVADRVLGVLFGASRSPHVFHPEEISLLSTFAGHAALVLHLTNLLNESQVATEQAAAGQRDAEWATSLHEEFTRLAVYGEDSAAIVAALSDALGREVVLIDNRGTPTAGHLAELRMTAALRDELERSAETGRSVESAEHAIELVVPLIAATGQSGALLVARAKSPLTPIEQRTTERAAMISALVTLRRDAISNAEEQVRGELAAGLLEATQRESSVHRAEARGYPVGEPWHVVTLMCDARHRTAMVSRLRRHTHWLTAPLLDQGVVVLAPTGEKAADDEIAREVYAAAGEHARIALYGTAESLAAAASAVPTTWQATRLARGLDVGDGVYNASILAPYTTLFGEDGARLNAYVGAMLGPVLEWDEQHGTQLLDTLIALFDNHWMLTRSAQSLHIHVNTIKQRIQRLRRLLGEDLDEPEARFRLELAARAVFAKRALDQTH